ncbi:glycoside hydrolase family 2 TIM barrel-domain containing protein [Chitinophaga rhizosphaerae]|uniref:glycoside hydrolase family 2 TIM barrel-domain containing protein n=1 Tax=Chitinophaga rhizosphaerae TaxID=1864947 RepID=UPI000F80EA6C|nr:glycoside hydrolase family 2 TIM barrel-domain containing protein [Chitinophaga rhizosphaerae]
MSKSLFVILFTFLCGSAMAQLPRLSPRPVDVVSLNGEWKLNGRYPVKVPGELLMQGFNIHEGEKAVYSRSLDISDSWKHQRVKLRFDAVSSHAAVFVNGVKVGEHEGGFVPFELDITEALNFGNDVLTVEVQALTVSDYLARTSQYAAHTVAGLLRKVTLFAVPETNLSDLTVVTGFDKNYKDATLRIRTAVTNESQKIARTEIRFTLKDATGKTVLGHTARPADIQAGATLPEEHILAVKAPKRWDPEHPHLYTLQMELLQDGKVTESTFRQIGFRQVDIRGNEVLVNGRAVKLRGINRHDVHPLQGRSLSPALDRQDAELFRAANCNYIRTSHYPPSEEFLDAADELGLFVESEAALTWINHQAAPIWKLWNATDEKFLPYMIRANADNIAAGKNHPSVIMWSLGNESNWSPLWAQVLAFVKKNDPSRPATFHDQCWGSYNNLGSKADIANYHYPGINGPGEAAKSGRPVLFGEYAHLSCYNRRELVTDPGVRAAWSAPLVTFYDSIYHYKGSLGGAIWSGIDDIFHLPGGKIVGYGPWGPIDGWRRPKPEYIGMKKAYEPVRITQLSDDGKQLTLQFANRYDFTSLKELRIEANGVPVGLDAAPGKTAVLKVKKRDGAVYVKITDPRGFVCVEERFAPAAAAPVTSRTMNIKWEEVPGGYTIRQGPYTWTISRTKGLIECLRRDNDTLMTQGPVVAVVPLNGDDGGKPNVAGETYQNNIYPLKYYPLYTLFARKIDVESTREGIRFDAQLEFKNAEGRQSYIFTTKGELITEYDVKYNGGDDPYQYGLLLQLPRNFDKMSWERNGEFSVYPADDIARNKGEARLNARIIGEVEPHGEIPRGSWKDDANELGSNDFRSTKRNITRVALANGKGDSLTVTSNGTQHSRTWLQDAAINWLIADYSNNGSEGFYNTPHSNGRMNIKNQPIKGKTIIVLP